MVRFLLLVSIATGLAYIDMKLLYGFIIGLMYCVVCEAVGKKKEEGDC
jgi:hypothetical protein